MKFLHKPIYAKAFMALAGAVLAASCSSVTSKTDAISDAESCSRLNSLIADHPNKFEHHKKNKRFLRKLTLWDATDPYPGAHNCEVWEWSTGLTSYMCEWESKAGKEGALAGYHKGIGIITDCLGSEWVAEANTTTTGGERTTFSKSDVPTVISIRYFKDNSLFENWSTVFYIGDRSNLNTETQ